jgi:hypothetical protein
MMGMRALKPFGMSSTLVLLLLASRAAKGAGPLPDLFVRAVTFQPADTCVPRRPVYWFQVTVGNRGTAPSPAIPGKALVNVMDQDGSNWGNGGTLGPILPGGSATASIPIYYFAANPAHMRAAAPHPFRATVDPLRLVQEMNEGNNLSAVIRVPAPRGC